MNVTAAKPSSRHYSPPPDHG